MHEIILNKKKNELNVFVPCEYLKFTILVSINSLIARYL